MDPLLTIASVYAASMVSKPEPEVFKETKPLLGAVHLYQTEGPPEEPLAALKLLPLVLTEAPARVSALVVNWFVGVVGGRLVPARGGAP